jgi:asparagine synthase (glutamine-hydrolysing)
MGALIAVVAKKGANVFNMALTMVETLAHRGSDAFGIASSRKVVIKKKAKELREESVNSDALIGHNFVKLLPRDRPQPVQNSDFNFVFDGRLFPFCPGSEMGFVSGRLSNVENDAACLIRKFKGDYVFAVIEDSRIIVGRDAVGARPLYFGENEDVCAVASERKALWKIGIARTSSFPPGRLAIINKEGFFFKTARTITQPPLQKLDIKTAAQQLRNALFQSAKERLSGLKEVAVAFSGGLDSSIIASLTRLCNNDILLIHVSLEEQRETAFVERAAAALDLPLHSTIYSTEDLEAALPRVLWLIEEPGPVNTSIAIPIFWAAEQSVKRGYRVLVTGQGGDELFGGYRRYLDDYEKHGLAGVQERLYQDITSSYETNFQRDNKVCAFHGVELMMPFADWKVIQFALSLTADLKIASPKDALRKRVLRRTARNLELPKIITEKPKKAVQYTTGVNKALEKLAKKEGLTLRKYVEKAFLRAYQDAR